jgi:hypothetical protein
MTTSTPFLLILANAEWPSAAPAPTLPHLSAALPRWRQGPRVRTRDADLSSGHEQAQALAMGLASGAHGALAWGAWFAGELGLADGSPCALISPCHWDINMTGVRMDDPVQLALSDIHSQALMAALEPLAREDGIRLRWLSATQWLAQGEVFAGLIAPSPTRVANQDLAEHLPTVPDHAEATRLLRRLQNEAQMLFYSHPVADARDAARLPAVNSIWYHGTGELPATLPTPQRHAVIDLMALHAHLPSAWALADAQAGQILREHAHIELLTANAQGTQRWTMDKLPWWQRWRARKPTLWTELLP